MRYGSHVDNAVMGTDDVMRSDLSFTLFISDPDSYGGGELVIESPGDSEFCKLDAGSLALYPSGALHRVERVTSGQRLVAVGWIQSLVRDPRRREVLFELETLKRTMFAENGSTQEFSTLSKNVANLWRLWVDV